MFRQHFIVKIDQFDQSAPQIMAHSRIDYDFERRRSRIRFGQALLFIVSDDLEFVRLCHVDLVDVDLTMRLVVGKRFWR